MQRRLQVAETEPEAFHNQEKIDESHVLYDKDEARPRCDLEATHPDFYVWGKSGVCCILSRSPDRFPVIASQMWRARSIC